eukprot:403377547
MFNLRLNSQIQSEENFQKIPDTFNKLIHQSDANAYKNFNANEFFKFDFNKTTLQKLREKVSRFTDLDDLAHVPYLVEVIDLQANVPILTGYSRSGFLCPKVLKNQQNSFVKNEGDDEGANLQQMPNTNLYDDQIAQPTTANFTDMLIDTSTQINSRIDGVEADLNLKIGNLSNDAIIQRQKLNKLIKLLQYEQYFKDEDDKEGN